MALLTRFRLVASHKAMQANINLRHLSLGPDILTFSEEVREAKLAGRPIVALESTIITHGMPYPQNLETANQVETIIRKQGAIPATIAILKGQVTVGLSADQLCALARSTSAVKTSRRDMAYVVANGLDGATTVAGTIVVAEMAGITVFATGGLGGVHRSGQHTLDVSADLTELGRSSTCVVCSGAKSILDIPRTLEYLETQGVLVAAFGSSRAFPAFYTRRSGEDAPYGLRDAAQVARVLRAAQALQLRSGVLVAVPVPQEHAMDESEIESAIEKSLSEAAARGVRGKEITPFLLAAVADTTRGRSLATNIALIKNNAKVGADIAVELRKLKNHSNTQSKSRPSPGINRTFTRGFHTSSTVNQGERGMETAAKEGGWIEDKQKSSLRPRGGTLVIGGANLDRTYRLLEADLKVGRFCPSNQTVRS